MKAIAYREYGLPHDVLKLEEIDKPTPKANEVLIRVHSASVNPLDSHVMTTVIGRFMNGFRRPRQPVPGVDASGVVEAVGEGVTRFKPGDAVFGSCEGAFAEYACAKESKLAKKPDAVTHEQAAAIPVAGLTALQALRDSGRLAAGQRVLIIGASGGVGTFAVQIAKHLGADVTAVCSTRNVDLVRSLGADRVVDYTQEDFATIDQPFDLILDVAGNRSISDYRSVLVPKGTYVGAGMLGKELSMPDFLAGFIGTLALKPFISQKLVTMVAKVNANDLSHMAELITNGAIKPVIDRRYPLDKAADAIDYVRKKQASGKVIINVQTV